MSKILQSLITEQPVDEADTELKETETTVNVNGKKRRNKRAKSTENIQANEVEGTGNLSFNTGDIFETCLTLLYSSSVAPIPFKSIHGIFYIWNNEVVNNRVRLTDLKSGIGDIKKIIGWVNADDLVKNMF